MSEPLGRPSIRKAIEKLKTRLNYKSTFFNREMKSFIEQYLEFIDKALKEKKLSNQMFGVSTQYMSNLANDLFSLQNLYIETLEFYLSELDETFDKALEDAKKSAEEQIKTMPERPLPKGYIG